MCVLILGILAGGASAAMFGNLNLTREIYGINVQAGGGIGVFILVVVFGMFRRRSR
jgi:hypothetical protein